MRSFQDAVSLEHKCKVFTDNYMGALCCWEQSILGFQDTFILEEVFPGIWKDTISDKNSMFLKYWYIAVTVLRKFISSPQPKLLPSSLYCCISPADVFQEQIVSSQCIISLSKGILNIIYQIPNVISTYNIHFCHLWLSPTMYRIISTSSKENETWEHQTYQT